MVNSRSSFSVTSHHQYNPLASADTNKISIEKDRQHSPLLPPKKGITTDYVDIEEEGIYSVPSSPMPAKKFPAEERLEKMYQNNSSGGNTINSLQVNKSHFMYSRIKQFEQPGGENDLHRKEPGKNKSLMITPTLCYILNAAISVSP